MDCGPTEFCELGTGKCIECYINDDCKGITGDRGVCDGNMCRDCTSDPECSPYFCMPAGNCGDCYSNADCAANLAPNERTCMDDWCGACVADSDCDAGKRC